MLLMHKDIPVADVTVCDGTIVSVNKIYNSEHYPPGAFVEHEQLLGRFLDNWQKMRAIPANRQNANQIITKIDCSLNDAAMKNMAVSLTDCYWFKDNNVLTWDDVNYYKNGFSSNFANKMLFGSDVEIKFNTPDFTTDGVLEKYWISLNGIPTMIKFGDFGDMAKGKNLLSANEVVATKIAELMGIKHVDYFPIKANGELVSACPCFIRGDDEEFVNALQLKKNYRLRSDTDLLEFLWNIGLQSFADDLITFVSIIGNTDCHTKNFGIIRNPNTLEIIGPAPLFDSGSCLGWNGQCDISKTVVKPFKDNFEEQLELVGQFPDSIPSPQEAQDIIEDVYQVFDISDECCENAKQAVENNINKVAETIQRSHIYLDDSDRYR